MGLSISIVVTCAMLAQIESRLVAADEPAMSRVANVIVCGIDRPFRLSEPFRPEPWWPVGAAMLRNLGRDHIVAYGRDVPALVADIERRLAAGEFTAIGRLEFWTHGGPGYFRIASRRCFFDLFDERRARPPDAAALHRLRELLTDDAIVHFRSCSTFQGMKGHAIALTASRFFCATGKAITVMGHIRPTGLTHPGWKTITPGATPNWSLQDGIFESEIEGAEILIRDLLRIFTAYAYDLIPAIVESESGWPNTIFERPTASR
ncbi:MAG: hypothetical protein ACKVS9_18255 [Phycisphaerae bacterium]